MTAAKHVVDDHRSWIINLTMFGTKATSSKTTTVSTRKPFRPAHIFTVGVAQARPLKLVAFRQACPPLHNHWSTHICSYKHKLNTHIYKVHPNDLLVIERVVLTKLYITYHWPRDT